MGSPTSRIVFRTVVVALLLLLVFYIGRPLYWKISATVHDIRNNKQTVREGFFFFFFFSSFSISISNFVPFFNYPFPCFFIRSFPNRHGGSEIGGVVPRRVRLRGFCRQSKAASSQSPFYTLCLVRYLLTYIHASIHVIPHFPFLQFSDLLRWFFLYMR